MTVYYVTITRPSGDLFTQSWDVWAQRGRSPHDAGDGEYVGNVPIGADSSSVTTSWTSPGVGTWKFMCVPIRYDVRGKVTNVP